MDGAFWARGPRLHGDHDLMSTQVDALGDITVGRVCWPTKSGGIGNGGDITVGQTCWPTEPLIAVNRPSGGHLITQRCCKLDWVMSSYELFNVLSCLVSTKLMNWNGV